MKWLDNAINKIVEKIEVKISGFDNLLSDIGDKLISQKEQIDALEKQLKEFDKSNTAEGIEFMNSLTTLDENIHNLRENISIRIDNETKLINEKQKLTEEDIVKRETKIREDLSKIVISSGVKFFERIDSIAVAFKGAEERIKILEEIKDRLDDGIILMTKQQLLKLIEQKIEVFEGNISNKMSGLMIYVNDKTNGNGKLHDTELLKKLARLEGIRDNAILKRKEYFDLKDSTSVNLIDSIIGDYNVNK